MGGVAGAAGTSCDSLLIAVCVFNGLYLMLLVLLRPLDTPMDGIVTGLKGVLSFVLALLSVVLPRASSQDIETLASGLMWASVVQLWGNVALAGVGLMCRILDGSAIVWWREYLSSTPLAAAVTYRDNDPDGENGSITENAEVEMDERKAGLTVPSVSNLTTQADVLVTVRQLLLRASQLRVAEGQRLMRRAQVLQSAPSSRRVQQWVAEDQRQCQQRQEAAHLAQLESVTELICSMQSTCVQVHL